MKTPKINMKQIITNLCDSLGVSRKEFVLSLTCVLLAAGYLVYTWYIIHIFAWYGEILCSDRRACSGNSAIEVLYHCRWWHWTLPAATGVATLMGMGTWLLLHAQVTRHRFVHAPYRGVIEHQSTPYSETCMQDFCPGSALRLHPKYACSKPSGGLFAQANRPSLLPTM